MFLINARQFEVIRVVGGIFLLSGLVAIGSAFILEHIFHMVPCELCLLERVPWIILILLGILSLLLSPRFARWPMILGVMFVVVSIGLSILHIGVEEGFWPSPFAACHTTMIQAANVTDWINQLPKAPIKPCDQPDYIRGIPLSVTMIAGLYSVIVFIISIFAMIPVFKHVKHES